jgi:hypothetical protein
VYVVDVVVGLVVVALAWRIWWIRRELARLSVPAWWTDPDEIGRQARTRSGRRPFRRRIAELPVTAIRQSGAGGAPARPAESPPGHVNGADNGGRGLVPRPRRPRQ